MAEKRRGLFRTLGMRMLSFGRNLMRHYIAPSNAPTILSLPPPPNWQADSQTPLNWNEPAQAAENFAPPVEPPSLEMPPAEVQPPQPAPRQRPAQPVQPPPAPRPAQVQRKADDKIDPRLLAILAAHQERETYAAQVREQRMAANTEVQRQADEASPDAPPQPTGRRRSRASFDYMETKALLPPDEEIQHAAPPKTPPADIIQPARLPDQPEDDDDGEESSPALSLDFETPVTTAPPEATAFPTSPVSAAPPIVQRSAEPPAPAEHPITTWSQPRVESASPDAPVPTSFEPGETPSDAPQPSITPSVQREVNNLPPAASIQRTPETAQPTAPQQRKAVKPQAPVNTPPIVQREPQDASFQPPVDIPSDEPEFFAPSEDEGAVPEVEADFSPDAPPVQLQRTADQPPSTTYIEQAVNPPAENAPQPPRPRVQRQTEASSAAPAPQAPPEQPVIQRQIAPPEMAAADTAPSTDESDTEHPMPDSPPTLSLDAFNTFPSDTEMVAFPPLEPASPLQPASESTSQPPIAEEQIEPQFFEGDTQPIAPLAFPPAALTPQTVSADASPAMVQRQFDEPKSFTAPGQPESEFVEPFSPDQPTTETVSTPPTQRPAVQRQFETPPQSPAVEGYVEQPSFNEAEAENIDPAAPPTFQPRGTVQPPPIVQRQFDEPQSFTAPIESEFEELDQPTEPFSPVSSSDVESFSAAPPAVQRQFEAPLQAPEQPAGQGEAAFDLPQPAAPSFNVPPENAPSSALPPAASTPQQVQRQIEAPRPSSDRPVEIARQYTEPQQNDQPQATYETVSEEFSPVEQSYDDFQAADSENFISPPPEIPPHIQHQIEAYEPPAVSPQPAHRPTEIARQYTEPQQNDQPEATYDDGSEESSSAQQPIDVFQALMQSGMIAPPSAEGLPPSRPTEIARKPAAPETYEQPETTYEDGSEATYPAEQSVDVYQALVRAGVVPPSGGQPQSTQRPVQDSRPDDRTPDRLPVQYASTPSTVMRAETTESQPEASQSSESGGGGDVDVDKLARDVYAALRSRLRIEKERRG